MKYRKGIPICPVKRAESSRETEKTGYNKKACLVGPAVCGGRNFWLWVVHIAFFEFGEPFTRFLLDYTAIMVLYVAISYYFLKFLTMWGKKKTDNGK